MNCLFLTRNGSGRHVVARCRRDAVLINGNHGYGEACIACQVGNGAGKTSKIAALRERKDRTQGIRYESLVYLIRRVRRILDWVVRKHGHR